MTIRTIAVALLAAASLAGPGAARADTACLPDATFKSMAAGVLVGGAGNFSQQVIAAIGATRMGNYDQVTGGLRGQTLAVPAPYPSPCSPALSSVRDLIAQVRTSSFRFQQYLVAFPASAPGSAANWRHLLQAAELADLDAVRVGQAVGAPASRIAAISADRQALIAAALTVPR